MARVTVEDCIDKVDDRFELVAVAAQRAKNIASGAELTMERNDEKNTVLSLREIASGSIEVDDLKEDLIRSYMRERDHEDVIPESELDAAGSFSDADSASAVMAEESESDIVSDEVIENVADDISFADDELDVED